MPALISLSGDPDLIYEIWSLWVATGRRFLPSQLLAEPIGLLTDVLLLDGLHETLKRIEDGDQDN